MNESILKKIDTQIDSFLEEGFKNLILLIGCLTQFKLETEMFDITYKRPTKRPTGLIQSTYRGIPIIINKKNPFMCEIVLGKEDSNA